MREYHYRVDREGRVLHDGSEIVDPATLRLFVLGMQATLDGRWLVVCQGEQNWFEADDTPLVVQRLALEVAGGGLARAEVVLPGGYREPLDPATLETADGRLYCRVRRGAIRARLGRVALQQIAPFIDDDDGPVLLVGAGRQPIREARPAP